MRILLDECLPLAACLAAGSTPLGCIEPDPTVDPDAEIKVTMAERTIVSDPEIMSGTPCFHGTRVPFKNLIDYLEGGHPLSEFLRQFPSVKKEMAVQALEEAKESLFARIA